MIKCKAFKYGRRETIYYLALIQAKELLSDYKIDAYDAIENIGGYQRKIQRNRAKKFADYLSRCHGYFNGTILLNIRNKNKVLFKKGNLTISDTLYVVDGQHRIEGLAMAVAEGYDKNCFIPVIITIGKNKNHEALAFLIINRTAKGIKTDLTDELIYKTIPATLLTDDLKRVLNLTVRKDIGEFALDVTKSINQLKDSIWYNRIAMPEENTTDRRIIRQRSFALSITEAIKSCGILKRAVNVGELDSVVSKLNNYWHAIAQICSKATEVNSSENYVLMKTVGVEVMNRLFARILDDVNENPEVPDFVESLKKMESFDDEAWKSEKGHFAKRGTNRAAIDSIYNDLEMEFDTFVGE